MNTMALRILGTPENDIITTSNLFSENAYGGAGDDVFNLSRGYDKLHGGPGNDTANVPVPHKYVLYTDYSNFTFPDGNGTHIHGVYMNQGEPNVIAEFINIENIIDVNGQPLTDANTALPDFFGGGF